jgi:chromosomal replication initiator protein
VIDAGGRVILTGDRLPNALVSLEDFVRSQVARGFVAELAAPDAQVRRNILRAKAAAGGVRLPDDCLDLLVATVRGSVRDLESVLIQLVTTSSLLDQPITLALAEEALAKKGASLAPYQRLDVATVIGAVTTFFKTTNDALGSKSRKRDVLVPRQLAMYLCNRYTDASLAEIGRALRRDHPAVRNAITRVERAVLERAPLRYQVEALSKRLDELASTNDRTS